VSAVVYNIIYIYIRSSPCSSGGYHCWWEVQRYGNFISSVSGSAEVYISAPQKPSTFEYRICIIIPCIYIYYITCCICVCIYYCTPPRSTFAPTLYYIGALYFPRDINNKSIAAALCAIWFFLLYTMCNHFFDYTTIALNVSLCRPTYIHHIIIIIIRERYFLKLWTICENRDVPILSRRKTFYKSRSVFAEFPPIIFY
jgi:hypothetical protein